MNIIIKKPYIKPFKLEIHKNPCTSCPSSTREPDDEVLDIKNSYTREQQLSTVFTCGWRDKLCKGYCDYLNITQEEINNCEELKTRIQIDME